MLERVARTVARHGMFEPGQRVAVALSGGADSVCLLHVLRELAPRWNLQLSILHVNHHLRGAESDGDAQFVCGLAAEFGYPIHVSEAPIAPEGNLEQAAREARLSFFHAAIESGSVHRVALGHTRDDQAETVLFRFLRGGGTAGLAGIRPVTSHGVVRPLLEVERADVESYLREHQIAWREDSTNATFAFARNRIRHHLLPLLEQEWNPAIRHSLSSLADWALAEESYWQGELDRLQEEMLIQQGNTILLQSDTFWQLPLAAARRLVRRAMELIKGDLRGIDFAHVSATMELARADEGHGRLQVPGVDIMRSFGWLRFGHPGEDTLENRNYRVAAPVPGVIPIPKGNTSVSLEIIENSSPSEPGHYVYNERMALVDWERLSGSLDLRNWRPGDQYQPTGKTGEEKIKTLFQEFRIPLWERRHWPVLTDGERIVWARRFGPDARLIAGPASRKILRISEIGIGRTEGNVYISS